MIVRKSLVRSMLQLMLLSAAMVALSTTRAQAHYEQWCLAQAAACSQMCGTSITHQLQYSVCVDYQEPPNQWECESTGWRGYYEWGWASGVENFECDEVSGSSWCQCVY